MAKAKADKGTNSIIIDEKDFASLGFPADKEIEVIKVEEGVWVITQKQVQRPAEQKENPADEKTQKSAVEKTQKIDEVEQRIIGYLKNKPFKVRVEGVFENTLSKEELKKLREMIKAKKVSKFKSNEKYKKSVYQVVEQETRNFENVEKGIEEFSLEKDGFIVVRNEQRAKRLSEELADRIKAGQIMGTKSFEGTFYIIDSTFYNEKSAKVLELLKQKKNSDLQELSKELALTPTVVKIVCTFLGEEGQILEKRREIYQYID
jgi:hypothetical protein